MLRTNQKEMREVIKKQKEWIRYNNIEINILLANNYCLCLISGIIE